VTHFWLSFSDQEDFTKSRVPVAFTVISEGLSDLVGYMWCVAPHVSSNTHGSAVSDWLANSLREQLRFMMGLLGW